jgi:hypothetical protein
LCAASIHGDAKFVLPLKSLRFCASLQPKKLENRVSPPSQEIEEFTLIKVKSKGFRVLKKFQVANAYHWSIEMIEAPNKLFKCHYGKRHGMMGLVNVKGTKTCCQSPNLNFRKDNPNFLQ